MDVATTGGMGGKMEPKRMVGLAYFAFAFAGGMFLTRLAEQAFSALRISDRQLFGIEELPMSAIVGFGIAIATALILYFNPKVHAGSLDVAAELKRVTWPSLGETRVSTVAVIVASVVSAGILFVFDFFSSKIMTVWVPHVLAWIAKL